MGAPVPMELGCVSFPVWMGLLTWKLPEPRAIGVYGGFLMQASSIINFTSSASLLSGEWGWAENPKLLIKPGLSGDQRPSRPSQSPLIRTKDTLGALITEEFTKVSGAYIRTRDVPGALITQEMTRVVAALCPEQGGAETNIYIYFSII